MWCPTCQADVATEVADDGQSLLCTACGGEVRKVFAPSLHPETRSARELLERWSAEDLLDEIDSTAVPSTQPDAVQSQSPPAARRSPGATPSQPARPAPRFRVDAAHPQPVPAAMTPPVHRPAALTAAARTPQVASPPPSVPPGYRQDSPQAALSGPHFDLQAAVRDPERSGRSESLWGQLLAYAGVGVLTVGTVLVLWGHFGALPNYASTGWLVATGGQMLLFLGVVTLISGGMQQTTHEVTRRVEYIGSQIVRIEQSTRDLLQGPHYGSIGDAHRAGVAVEHDGAADER